MLTRPRWVPTKATRDTANEWEDDDEGDGQPQCATQ